jgi:hypothetical protein
MQEDFLKLSEDDKRKFLIKNILDNKYFEDVHKIFKNKYPKYIYNKKELELILKKQKFDNYIKGFISELKTYNRAVNNCALHQSRYKDIVYDVYSSLNSIEDYCYSKYISSKYKKELIMEIVKNYYNDATSTVSSYGGETYGDQDQTLRKAMRIILNSPHLDNKIKKTKDYKRYYSMFFNKEDEDYAGDDCKMEKYGEYEKEKKEIYEYTNDILSDDDNNDYYSDSNNSNNSNDDSDY